MEISEITRELDGLISQLVQARGVLTGLDSLNVIKPKRGRPTKPGGKSVAIRSLSREARAKIAAAQKARWAKRRKEAAAAQRTVTASATAGSVSPKKAPAKKSIPTKKS